MVFRINLLIEIKEKASVKKKEKIVGKLYTMKPLWKEAYAHSFC